MRAWTLALLASCATEAEPQWFQTCGDPVCGDYAGPVDGVPICADEQEGAACEAEGAECDQESACNTRLRCTTEDPTAQVGGCPISLAKHKRQIHYLSEAERAAAARRALDVALTTWRYTWEGDDTPSHLGFLIDDVGASPMVAADGGHVDLYGYTSVTLAAVQATAAELELERARRVALEARVEALERALSTR